MGRRGGEGGYNKLARTQRVGCVGVLQNVRVHIRGGGGHFFTKNCVRTKWMTSYSRKYQNVYFTCQGATSRHCACGSSPALIPAPNIDRFYRLNNSGARKIKDYHIFPKQTHFTSNVFRCSLCQSLIKYFPIILNIC